MANLYKKSVLITKAWEGDLEAIKLIRINPNYIDDIIKCAYSNHKFHIIKYLFKRYSHYYNYISSTHFINIFNDAFQRFDVNFVKLLVRNLTNQHKPHWIVIDIYRSLLYTSSPLSKLQAAAIYDIFADAGLTPSINLYNNMLMTTEDATNMDFLYLFVKNGMQLNFVDNGKIYSHICSDNMSDNLENIKNNQLQRYYKIMKKSRNLKLQKIDEILNFPRDISKIVQLFIPFENDFNFIHIAKEKIITSIMSKKTIFKLIMLLFTLIVILS